MLCCWNCYCKCERDPTEESPKRWCALRCNVHWILSLLRTTYLYSCRKWSNLEPVIGCGDGGQKLTNSQEKKQGRRVRLKPWSAHGQAPVQTPLMPKTVVVLQSHHPPAPNSPSPPQHTQTGSIVSKAAAGTGALRCLQHANPGRALLALCLRGLPGHP